MTRLQNSLFAFLLCIILLFTACQSSPASSGGVDNPQSTASEPSAAETATLTARLVDISGNLLLLAGKDDGVYRCARPKDAPNDLIPGMMWTSPTAGISKPFTRASPITCRKSPYAKMKRTGDARCIYPCCRNYSTRTKRCKATPNMSPLT